MLSVLLAALRPRGSVRVDDFVDEDVLLMKVDVEGYEQQAALKKN